MVPYVVHRKKTPSKGPRENCTATSDLVVMEPTSMPLKAWSPQPWGHGQHPFGPQAAASPPATAGFDPLLESPGLGEDAEGARHPPGRGHRKGTSSTSSNFSHLSFDTTSSRCEPKLESRGLFSKHLKTQSHNYNWRAEIFTAALAVAMSLAVVGFMVYADGRPLDAFDVSLNTLVSVLGALTRGSLAFAIGACLAQEKWNRFRRNSDSLIAFGKFEDASRGPWGSLQLLWWLGIRHWASLGALVMILLISFDALLQSAIAYQGKLADTAGIFPPSVPVSQRLDAGSYVPNPKASSTGVMLPHNQSISLVPYTSQPDLNMAAAIYNGFMGIPVKPAFHCAQGNCTWTPVHTLGVCSACTDISECLVKTRDKSKSGSSSSGPVVIEGYYTNYSLPYASLKNVDGKQTSLSSAYMVVGSTVDARATLSFQDMNTMISAFSLIRAAKSYEEGMSRWDQTKVSATECALYFCVKRLESTVIQGELEERATEVWAGRAHGSFSAVDQDPIKGAFDNQSGHALYHAVGDFARYDLKLRLRDSSAESGPKSANGTSFTTDFNVSQNTAGSMAHFLHTELFHRGQQLVWPAVNEPLGFFPLSVMQTLYASSDVAATLDRVATSMTNWARDASASTTPPQLGTGQSWVVHIRVQWEYLALPLAAIVGGCVFILLAIVETRGLDLVPWKTDTIATLTHSLDAEARAQLRFAARNGHVRQTSKSMRIDFGNSGHGFELRAQHERP